MKWCSTINQWLFFTRLTEKIKLASYNHSPSYLLLPVRETIAIAFVEDVYILGCVVDTTGPTNMDTVGLLSLGNLGY